MLSATELINVLVTKYEFTYNDGEEIEEMVEEFGLDEDALVFNLGGDYITECEEPEESDVEKIYQFIRESGWSLLEHPLDANAWILCPTKSLKDPIKSLL